MNNKLRPKPFKDMPESFEEQLQRLSRLYSSLKDKSNTNEE